MKRKSIISLLCLMMVTCFLAGCDMLGKEPHVHTFDTEWTHDATSHWYEATCDCEDVEVVKANHVDENNDSLCDVCKYDYDHAHTFQTEDDWTVDCTNHWRAATCGHLVAAQDVEAHADTNGDGKCDTCNYVIEDIHKHVYADGWTTDDEYHWHAAICEHKAEISGKEEHKLNAAGDCLVCGEHLVDVDPTSVEEVLLAAQANDYKISFGDVIATEAVYGGTGAQILENGKTNRVHFALGNGESYIQYISFDKNGNYLGQEEQWFERISKDEVFGAAMLDGEYELSPIAGDAQFLNGYNYIPGSILPSASNDTSTLANLFVGLYKQMKAGERVSAPMEDGVYVAGGNPVEGYDPESGKYEFAYTYYSVNANTDAVVEGKDEEGNDIVVEVKVNSVEIELYNVAVTFSINEDMIIDAADFYVEVYRDYSNIKDGKEVGDPDLSYTYTADKMGNITINDLALKATANPSFYTYTVAQTAGDRSFTTPYPKNALIPTSFEFNYVLSTDWNEDYTEQIVTAVEPVGDSYVIQAGDYAKFAIGDVIPKTASTKFLNTDDFTYTFVNKDPDSTARAWYDSDSILNGYDAFSQLLKLKIRDIGEYTVTLKCGEVTKVFDLSVVAEKPIVLPEDDENTVNVATTDTYNWEKDKYSYTAGEADTYTFTVPAGLGIMKAGANAPLVDYYDNTNGTNVEVELAAGEKFEFYVAAITKKAWAINVTKGIIEEPEPELQKLSLSLEADGNAISENNLIYTYMATEEGTLNLFFNAWVGGSNPSMSYSINGDDPVTVEPAVDAFLTLYAYDYVEITVLANGGYATLFASWSANAGGGEGGEETLEASLAGYYDNAIGSYSIGFYQDSETFVYYMNIYGTGFDLYYTYDVTENTDGTLTIVGTFCPDHWMSSATTDTIGAAGKEIIATPNGDSWTFSCDDLGAGEGGEEGGDEGETTEPDGSEANPYVVTDGFSIYLGFDTWNPVFVQVKAGVTASVDCAAKFYTDPTDMSTAVGTSVTPEVDTVYVIYADTMAGCTGMLIGGEVGFEDDNSLEGSGTDADPYVLLVLGDYTCAFPGGMDYVFYSYTPSVAGTFTVTILTSDYYWGMGTDLMMLENLANAKDSYSVVVDANEKVYVGISTYSGDAADVDFAISFVANEDPEVVADGSATNPYALEENNTCAFPGGMNYVYYTYTTETAGTLTVTMTSADYFWAYGSGAYALENVGSSTPSVEIAVAAGETVWVGISTNSMEEAEVTFTASFVEGEAGGEEEVTESALVIGSTQINAANGVYAYTATEKGTLTLTAGAAMMGMVEISYTVNGGESNVLELSTSVELELEAGDKVVITVVAEGYSSITAAWEVYVAIPALKIGSTSVEQKSATYQHIATEDGTLTLKAGAALMGSATFSYSINGGEAVSFAPQASVEIVLSKGDKVLVTVNAENDYSSITANWTAKPDGTESKPYVVESLPTDITVTANCNDMIWYTFTVEETGTFTATFNTEDSWFRVVNAAGTVVISGYQKGSYTDTLEAGTYTMGIATWTAASLEVTVNVKFEVASVGGEEGGETTSVVTYMSAKHGSGRYLKVEIDAAAGTMTLTRSNMSGGWDAQTSTAVYSYAYANGTVTATFVSGTSCTCVFDSNGAPSKITWGSAAFEGFTVQA